jgi:hypothetical protein
MDVKTELPELISRLKSLEQGCEDQCLDLKMLKFDIHENEMKLFNEFHSYYFKNDPKNPRDPRVIHAIKQFCGLMGVPYSFFAKNPEYMRRDMVSCWLPSLRSEKSSVLAKLRSMSLEKGGYIIRAILPVEYTNLTNSQVMDAMSREVLDDYRIDFVIGDERDELVLHIRLIAKEEFEVCGEKCSVGFSVVCSELGASALTVDTLLYRGQSKGSLLASYGGESFFSFEYSKIQKKDLQSLFPPLMIHLREKLTDIKQRIQQAKEQTQKKENTHDLLRSLKLIKGLNDKFHTMLFQELEKDDTVKTRWDFVNKMAIIAKDFDVTKRLKIERTAGNLLDLNFPKN